MAMQNDNVNNNMQNDDNLPEVIDMTCNLHQPSLEELASVMNLSLAHHFNHVAVNVVECPNLLTSPYFLPAPGICGDAQVIEFGNHEHLYNPSKNKRVSWILPQYINQYTSGTCHVIGNTMSRGIPNKDVGMNFVYSSERAFHKRESNYIFLNEEGQVETKFISDSCPVLCDLYGSVYVCNGKRDKVLEVYVKEDRKYGPHMEILTQMWNAISYRYNMAATCVGLSGLLFISSGKLLASVMPRTFPQTLLQNKEEINNWNRNFKISAPMVVHSTMFNSKKLNIIYNERLYDKKFCTVNSLSSHILRNPKEKLIASRLFKNITARMECRGYFNVVSKLHRVGAEVKDSPN
ncbi:ester hydrolase C11orf54-like isoform X1 [Temnothorax curvispinosus]|uniref:Ester hydrolase C11orf54-like isoform X1 n=1 Tax=Temnothorax curvispinosus TaxID=300111 RepID=A0A6J1PEA0_9HYME|nr:ester hydrolase C11orf54-like isoform X1 [Temnothorax curvispinosus]